MDGVHEAQPANQGGWRLEQNGKLEQRQVGHSYGVQKQNAPGQIQPCN